MASSEDPKAVPTWGDNLSTQAYPGEATSHPLSGWLNGLIQAEPQPLPPRPPGADGFNKGGNWLAGLLTNPEDSSSQSDPESAVTNDPEVLSRADGKGQKGKSATGEVALGVMLAKAAEVEADQPRAAWTEPAPFVDPDQPPPPVGARPTVAEEVAAPAWVAKLEQSSPASAAVHPEAQPAPNRPPQIAAQRIPVADPAPSSASKPVKVDGVATSLPRRTVGQDWSASQQRQRVSFYRSLTAMLAAGLPMFSVFEFLGRQSETTEQREACRRISQDLVAGQPLHRAAYNEPALFSEIAVKLVEVGMRTGKLVAVLQRLAADEEHRWRMRQTLQSHLFYPVCIASITLVAVVLLPPFVLADLLTQVVHLTSRPPALTLAILWFSNALSSPIFLGFLALAGTGTFMALKSDGVRRRLIDMEPLAWDIPGLGNLIQSAVSLRFLRVFAMTYDVGLSAPQCLILACEATGSRRASIAGPRMKEALVEGGTLRETLEVGGFLPRLVIEAMEAGQQSGDVSGMMESVARIVDSELEYRIETLMALIEPLFMAALGAFVGVFAIGCLLPILKLSESL